MTRLLSTLCFALGLTSAPAAVVVTAEAANTNHSTDSAYPDFWTDHFSNTGNLLAGLTPQTTGNFAQPYGGMNTAAINDGVLTPVPTNGDNLSMFAGVGPDAGTQVIFTLAQPSYISQIQYFGGWVDSGRCDINFTVSYSTDGGLSYTALIDPTGGFYSTKGDPGDVQTGGMNDNGNATFVRALGGITPISNYVSVTDNATAYLGNNAAITNLRFDFGNVSNGWAGVEELTATGVAVPEVSTSMLGLMAISLGLVRRSRRLTRG